MSNYQSFLANYSSIQHTAKVFHLERFAMYGSDHASFVRFAEVSWSGLSNSYSNRYGLSKQLHSTARSLLPSYLKFNHLKTIIQFQELYNCMHTHHKFSFVDFTINQGFIFVNGSVLFLSI